MKGRTSRAAHGKRYAYPLSCAFITRGKPSNMDSRGGRALWRRGYLSRPWRGANPALSVFETASKELQYPARAQFGTFVDFVNLLARQLRRTDNEKCRLLIQLYGATILIYRGLFGWIACRARQPGSTKLMGLCGK